VKSLATQTAKATGDISAQIMQIQAATGEAVTAIQGIGATIDEVNVIASHIAAAVEEQGAATAEIARNVNETAMAARDMESRIGEVSAEAERTGRQATDFHDNTTALAAAVGDLQRSVVRVVRTSSTDVDRRAAPRFAMDLVCRVSGAGGTEQAARLVDLSDSGACIVGGPALLPGAGGSLILDGVGAPLPFTVRHAGEGKLHVVFAMNATTAGRLRPLLDRLGARRAA
jgi:ABC-type transporter Mla subunit MlaD